MLSIWPETYCHTLTEIWACGLPVVAFKLGAMAERIAKYGGGWLLDPSMTPAAFLEFLVALKRDVRAIRAKQEEVLNWQGGCGRHYDTKAMAVSYDLLYRDVLGRRRSFRNSAREAHLRSRTALVIASRGRTDSDIPASTHIRILERTNNKLSRPIIFREVTASYPWDNPDAGPANLVLIQRDVIKPFDVPNLVARCRSARLPIIVDVDDDLTAVPPDKDPTQRYRIGAEAFKVLLKSASLVLVSTHALKDRLTEMANRIEVVPSRLSARLWATRLQVEGGAGDTADDRPSRCRILYMGTITHDDDLEMIRPAIEALRGSELGELHVVGGQVADADWFERVPIPEQVKNYPSFVPWFRALARSFDLAVAPLRDTPFNLCKSDLKGMDYGAAGLAALLSDVATFSGFRDQGWALLIVNQPDAWEHALAILCMDPDARGRIARQARRGIRNDRMIRHGGEDFDDIIGSATIDE
ncbi:MAG: hypothetical protein JO189_10385 [Deltaproteobacteria bacterium]|nr:hypothetical protein [Deltaproteobacteria bacterium]